jgi:tetratricopeptide (TPR) repeat protein
MMHISRFTPSTMPPKTLEDIFVQRGELAEDTVDRVRESALRGSHHYLLFIGPRGCGKTHFVSLVYHRLRNIEELADALRIAWLTEDETSTSFLDLQLRIYRALSRDYPDEFPQHALDGLYDLPPQNAVDQVSREIVSRLKDRTGLVIVENLDQIFEDIGREGQHAWRAFLQESSKFSILAAAQQLFPGVSNRNAPFFGSFQTIHFELLSALEGRTLLMNIARLHGDRDLVKFLSTSRGRARVRALQHLSGGNHRVYVVLSEFINADDLDELIGPFEKMLDDLTPYYQERLRWLSAQQRRIVEYLCKLDRPVPVKEIARALFTSSQSISRQLVELKEKRYVRSATRGRESLYELTEPLMRMALELKEHRGGPIRLIVDFLRAWYDRSDLDSRLRRLPETARLERLHVQAAIRKIDTGEEHPCVTALLYDLDRLREKGDPRLIMEAMEELEEFRSSRRDRAGTVSTSSETGDPSVEIQVATEIIEQPGAPVEQVARALVTRGIAKGQLGDAEGEIEDYTRVIELEGAPVELVARALVYRGITKGQLGDAEGEIEDDTRVIELEGAPVELVARALVYRGITKGQLGDAEGEIEDDTRVIELEGAPVELVARALVTRGVAKGQLGDAEGETEDFTHVIELEGAPVELVAVALVTRGVAKGQLGDAEGEIEDFTHVIELEGAPVELVAVALANRGIAKGQLGDTEGEIEDFTHVIELEGAPVELVARALVTRGIEKGQLGDAEGAIEDDTRVIELEGAPVELVASALANRGVAKWRLGDAEGAIEDCTHVIELEGAPVEQVAWAFVNRGVVKGQLGDAEGAIEDYTRLIEPEGAPVELVAGALVNRGVAKRQLSDAEGAIEDYTRVIELEGAPGEAVAVALVTRGVAKRQLGDAEGAIEDYTRAIELEGAPVKLVAMVLVTRGIAKGQLGDAEGEIEDCTSVIELEGAPSELVASALNGRAVHLYLAGRFEEAERDVTRCLALSPEMPQAHYTRAELLLASGRWEDGWRTLADCLDRFPPDKVGPDKVDPICFVRILFKSTHDVATWAARVEKLVELYDRAKALTVLGDSLVRSTADLVNHKPPSADFLAGWRAAWHSAGQHREPLTLVLRLFDVALNYVESRDPKSLLDLPIEQRALLEQLFDISAEDD